MLSCNGPFPQPIPPVFTACGWIREASLSKRKMRSDFVAADNRCRDEVFPQNHRAWQIPAERERGANRRGISAAGAVSGHTAHKWRGQKKLDVTVPENINRLTGLAQVAAFGQNRAA